MTAPPFPYAESRTERVEFLNHVLGPAEVLGNTNHAGGVA